MQTAKLTKAIIRSESDYETCYYEITKDKVFCKRNFVSATNHNKAGIVSFNCYSTFETETTKEMWDYILHYNNALKFILEEERKVKEKNLFTVELHFDNNQKIENSFNGKINKNEDFGLLRCLLFFPDYFEKPFWAK